MNYVNLYVNFLEKQADLKKPLKVVFDCSNGPAGLVLKRLKIPNSKFIILNSEVDDRFPAHGPNPLEKHALDDVKKEVKKRKADLGIAFDADADRAVFVDNSGKNLPFYAVMLLLSIDNRPPYVGDVYVAKTMEHLGILKTQPSRVGTYYIKQTMKRLRASFGGEISGHYYFREIKNADSGILAAIKVLNTLSLMPYTSAQFSEMLPDFYYEQFNQKTKNPAVLMKKIARIYFRKALGTSRLDGFLFDFKDWFMIVRPSNTEPLLRFFVGSRDKVVFQKELKKLKSFIS